MPAVSLSAPVGVPAPQPRAARLLAGRGRFVDDLALPRMLHLALVRSPHAHARIVAVDTAAALAAPGVVAVVAGAEMARACRPWISAHALYPGLKSPPQHPLAIDRACWNGEPAVAVVAASRAQAEDAAELVRIEWQDLPPVADARAALAPDAPLLHPELGGNLAFDATHEAGAVDAAFAAADLVVEERFQFGRHTGVPLEPRAVIADYEPGEGQLTVWQSHQVPHQMQDIYARLLDLPEHRVRVVCPDVGGGFGIKLHHYPDEFAAVVLSRMLGRPVKFVADRLESFLADIHARDHLIAARMALAADGRILAIEVDDLAPIGAYSVYPRTSMGEIVNVRNMTGAPYRFDAYRARSRLVLQSKAPVGQYRAVGHPVACAVTERLVDLAAGRLGVDPMALRRRNLIGDGERHVSPAGQTFEGLSLGACLDRLEALVGLPALRAEQAALRSRGVHRGIGLAAFIEVTATGPQNYGRGGIRISSQDGCMVKLEPSGTLRCFPSVTEQGQGTDTGIAQIVAAAFGVGLEDVRVVSGDTEIAPYGGGAFASRGITIGGEAALAAAQRLRGNVLALAAAVLQADPAGLDIRAGRIVDAAGGERMTVAALAELATFRQFDLPGGIQPELTAVGHFVAADRPFVPSNGVQLALVEVDADTGFVTLLRHVVVHDGGVLVNPLLVEEQIRGGVVQGIGAALWEECLYDAEGQLLNASLADYLVPMAAELPDIEVAHVVTPPPGARLGTRGVGEAGTCGASAAVLNAINDALSPLGAAIATLPCTPERILRALGRV